jgi:hypothetical protein
MNSSLLSGIFNGCNGSDSSQSIALALRTLTWLIAPCIRPACKIRVKTCHSGENLTPVGSS